MTTHVNMPALATPPPAEPQAPLLGPPFTGQTPQTFLAYVESLYHVQAPRKSTRAPTPPKPKGRTTVTATKTRRGQYELTYATQAVTFPFDKTKTLTHDYVRQLATCIKCSADELNKFLTSRKFTLT